MYLTTAISIMLVLTMVGVGCVLLLSATSVVRQVRQNVALDVVIDSHASSQDEQVLDSILTVAPYCRQHHYISREQALKDHIQSLGEDPTRFLGYNPLLPSYHVDMNEDYASADSLAAISARLSELKMVDRVVYSDQVVSLMDRYIGRAMIGVFVAAALLLLVAWALIMNMIRLRIYANRFLINTMTLVGATAWHVRRPFVRRAVAIGMAAAFVATLLVTLMVYMVWYWWGFLLFPLTLKNIGFILLVIFGTAALMTMLAAFLATSRYIRMKTSSLYEI